MWQEAYSSTPFSETNSVKVAINKSSLYCLVDCVDCVMQKEKIVRGNPLYLILLVSLTIYLLF